MTKPREITSSMTERSATALHALFTYTAEVIVCPRPVAPQHMLTRSFSEYTPGRREPPFNGSPKKGRALRTASSPA